MESKIGNQLGCDHFGFRENEGTSETILSFRTLIEKQLELNKDTLILLM